MSEVGDEAGVALPADRRARVAIDLGAESCRISLLRWRGDQSEISEVHRFANGPVQRGGSYRWPLSGILTGLEEGLRKAAHIAGEGIASIAVDGWAVDYVRLDEDGKPLYEPFCYRDERTIASKERADEILPAEMAFQRTGAAPLRINTIYQLLADEPDVAHAPWVCLPEYVLHWLGAPRIAEFTNATHTGLVDPATGAWTWDFFEALGIPSEPVPRIVAPGTRLGWMRGPLSDLPPYRETELIAPACHDTASAIAGIPVDLDSTAYICSGTWSLVGTLISQPITSSDALAARYTNQGAASGGFCFHTNVNGMWLVKQCMEAWSAAGRVWSVAALVDAAQHTGWTGIIDVDAEALMTSGNMPSRINEELRRGGRQAIPDIAGNEPMFARVIFESLAVRYATALRDLEKMLGHELTRVHVIGGASRTQLLARLATERCGIPVNCGHPESSTIGNFAVQLSACEDRQGPLTRGNVRRWAERLCSTEFQPCN
jgi:rhamnulokinase